MTKKACTLCPRLVGSRKRVVRDERLNEGADTPRVMLIGEAPGFEEDRYGLPFRGASGQELRSQVVINGLGTHDILISNILKCRPPGNADPTAEEIDNCTSTYLYDAIAQYSPQFIITLGRFASAFFLGPINMEMSHGIPHYHDFSIIIPCYHPAAGLHSPERMILFHRDMRTAADVIKGKIGVRHIQDSFKGMEDYRVIRDPDVLHTIMVENQSFVAVDTEWAKGKPWCLSLSTAPGRALVVMADDKVMLDQVNKELEQRTAIIHNALYDLPVLERMGVYPTNFVDTMVMAYLLQDEPQGLKPLSYRHLGMEMSSYSDMVREASQSKAMAYLLEAVEYEWPDPDPVLEWSKGEPKVRQPQTINKKLSRLLKDFEKGKDVDLLGRINKMEGIDQVKEVLGPVTEADLSEIDFDDAVMYAARDADATMRLYPRLEERVRSLGLWGTLMRDMRMMPMVVDMMANGMPISRPKFEDLSEYFADKMRLLERKMQVQVASYLDGKQLNPGSHQQMSYLIYKRLRLHEKGGTHKSRKGAAKESTANDILSRYVDLHPFVQMLMDWRAYQKLKTTYSDVIPRLAGEDDRIRTTLRTTRVATGRLSSSGPNLLAQPSRSEDGRKVRDCYECEPGRLFVSGDYSQVEMRVAASDAQDEAMLEIFWKELDVHSQTASKMFKIPVEHLDEMKHRYPAKRVGFGILYLMSAQGLQRTLAESGLEWTIKECNDMIESWFKAYPGIAEYLKTSGIQARRYGYVRDLWGRIRYIPGIRSTDKFIRMEAERQAGNAPVQMGAQGIMKEAMGRLVPVYKELGIMPLLQIHDDIVWEMDESMVDIAIPRIKGVMESAAPDDFLAPLKVDFKVGPVWGSMEKYHGRI